MSGELRYHWIAKHWPIEKAFIPGSTDMIKAWSTDETWKVWKAECAKRGIAPENPIAEFHDCACRAMSEPQREQCCRIVGIDSPSVFQQPRLVGIDDIRSFFRKVKDWAFSKESITKETAEKRAAICLQCRFNSNAYLPGCPSCSNVVSEMASELFSIIGDKRTFADERLNHCGICSCNLKIVVWIPNDVLKKNQTETYDFPEWCWQSSNGS